MQIRPSSVPGPPVTAASSNANEAELVQLARDVVESGARIEVPAKVAWLFTRYREADAEETVRHLDQPLLAHLPGLATPLPLQGEEDLRELAVFQNLRPATELEEPERATALQQLAAQGWNFSGAEGEIGCYGAYNQLAQGVTARKDQRSVRLGDDGKLSEMARFYSAEQPELSARLEEQGYRFFDASGRVGSAFELGSEARIGRDGRPWFAAGDPGTLESRAETFSKRLAQIPDLELALRFQELVESKQLTPENATRLLEGRSQRGAVAAAIASEYSSHATRDFCDAGLKICAYGNTEAQTAWLDELARRADAKETGSLASDVFRKLKSDNARYYVWHTAMESPGSQVTEFGQRLYKVLSGSEDRQDLRVIGQTMLEALPASAGVDSVRRWGCDPDKAARALLLQGGTGDLRKLALEATEWNAGDAQRLQLEELAADPKTAQVGRLSSGVFGQLKSENARYYLWNAAMKNADQPVEKFARELYGSFGKGENAQDAAAIGRAVLAGLEGEPSTAEAARMVQRWQSNPDTAARAVVSKPGATATELALASTGWNDQGAHLKQLEELAQSQSTERVGRVALQAYPQLASENARYYLWNTAMQKSDQSLGTFAKALYDSLGTSENAADRATLGRVLLDAMAEDPDLGPGVAAVRKWQSDPDTAARALARTGGDNLGELALEATTWNDRAAQRRQLEELCANPATEKVARLGLLAFDQLDTENSRYYLWKAVLQKAEAGVSEFARTLYGTYSTTENRDDQKCIGRAILEAMAAEPATATAAAAVQRWQPDPGAAARALADSGDANLRELALQATTWNDHEAQRQQLEELAADPGTAQVGRLGQEIFAQLKTENSRYYVWKAAMTHADKNLQGFSQGLYSNFTTSENAHDQRVVGMALLEAMAAEPATARAAQAVQGWQSDPNTAARALANHAGSDLCALARVATTWNDAEAQRKQLEELAADSRTAPVGKLALDAFNSVSRDNSRYYVWTAALETADKKPVDFGKALYASYSQSEDASDRKKVGEKLIAALEAEPTTARAAATVRRWQSDPDTGARGLCQKPHAGTRELALTVTGWNDVAAQRRQLDELADGSGTRSVGRLACAMFNRVKTENGRYYVWNEAMSKADRPVPEFVSGLLRQGQLGQDAGEVLAAYLDTRGQQASLKEIAALAREVVPHSGYSGTVVKSLLEALERHPATPPSLASQMAQQRARPDAQQLGRLLGELERIARSEDEVRHLAEEMKASNTGISEEDERIIVGGVVLRKGQER